MPDVDPVSYQGGHCTSRAAFVRGPKEGKKVEVSVLPDAVSI